MDLEKYAREAEFCVVARRHNHYALTNTETGAWLHRALLRLEARP